MDQPNVPRQINRVYIKPPFVPYQLPEKNPSQSVVDKLLLVASTDDYFNIQKTLIDEKGTFNIIDRQNQLTGDKTKGRTILHCILNNANLTNANKYDLIKTMVSMGAPLDRGDQYNVRPLHLASSQQNGELVNFFLDGSADPNSKDNQDMNPLHYALRPTLITCPEDETKNAVLAKKSQNRLFSEVDEIKSSVYNFMQTDPHIQTLLNNVNSVFKSYYKNIFGDVNVAEIVNKLLAEYNFTNASAQAEFALKRELIQLKKIMVKNVQFKLGDAINPFALRELDSKHPDVKHVLPYDNIADFLENAKKHYVDIDELVTKMLDQINLIGKIINDLEGHIITNAKLTLGISHIDMYFFVRRGAAMINVHLISSVKLAEMGRSCKLYNMLTAYDDMFYKGMPNINNTMDPLIDGNADVATLTANAINNIKQMSTVPRYVNANLSPNSINIFEEVLVFVAVCRQTTENIRSCVHDLKLKLMRKCDIYDKFYCIMYTHFYVVELIYQYVIAAKKSIDEFYKSMSFLASTLTINREYINTIYNSLYTMYAFGTALPQINTYSMTNGTPQKIATGFVVPPPFASWSSVEPTVSTYKGIGKSDCDFVLLKNDADGSMYIGVVNNKNYKAGPPNAHQPNTHTQLFIEKPANVAANTLQQCGDIVFITLPNAGPPQNMYVDTYAKDMLKNATFARDDAPEQIYKICGTMIGILNNMLDNINISHGLKYVNGVADTVQSSSPLLPIDCFAPFEFGRFAQLPSYEVFNATLARIGDKGKLLDAIYGQLMYKIDANAIMYDTAAAPQPCTTGFIPKQVPKVGVPVSYRQINPSGIGSLGAPTGQIGINNTTYNAASIIPQVVCCVLEQYFYVLKHELVYNVISCPVIQGAFTKFEKTLMPTADAHVKNDKKSQFYKNVAKTVDQLLSDGYKNLVNTYAMYYIYDIFDKTFNIGGTITIATENILQEPRVQNENEMSYDDIINSTFKMPPSSPLPWNAMVNIVHPTDKSLVSYYRIHNTKKPKRIDDVCYSVNMDVIASLVSKGTNVNARDVGGNCPLKMAILLNNHEIVKTLLQGGASIRYSFKSAKYDMYKFCFEQLILNVDSAPFVCHSNVTNRIIEQVKTKTNVHVVPLNAMYIVPMALYLLDHELTRFAKRYPNMWTLEKHKEMLAIIDLPNKGNYVTLTNIDKSKLAVHNNGTHMRDELEMKLAKAQENINRILNALSNLQHEIDDPQTSADRIGELRVMISELHGEKKHINKQKNNMENALAKLNSLTHDALISQEMDAIYDAIVNFKYNGPLATRGMTIVYNSLYSAIGKHSKTNTNGNDIYTQMWRHLLVNSTNNDPVQLVHCIYNHIIDRKYIEPDILTDAYGPIIDVFNNVLAFYAQNYFELPAYLNYSSNYNQYDAIFDILVHVFKHMISYDFVNTVKYKLNQTYSIGNLHSIDATSIFFDYCVEQLPRIVIKNICGVKKWDNDPDVSQMYSTLTLLENAIDMLDSNKELTIDPAIIIDIKQTIVPFFGVYMDAFASEMQIALVAQLKSFLIQTSLFKIAATLATKVNNS